MADKPTRKRSPKKKAPSRSQTKRGSKPEARARKTRASTVESQSAPASPASTPPRQAAPPPHPAALTPEQLAELEEASRDARPAEEAARAQEPAPIPALQQTEPIAHQQFLRGSIPSLFVAMIAPEMAPVAKVGGLADVVFGLSRELEIRGHSIEIILPKYDCLKYHHIWGLTPTFNDLWVPWYGGAVHCTVYFGFVHGRKCFFIEPHSQDRFFDRGKVYGDGDDVLRFAFFCRASLEFLFKSGKHPDILHIHDWQTALVPVFLFEVYQHLGMGHPRVCFTIHNFRHQGVTGEHVLRATGLNRPEYYFHPDRLGGHHPGSLNLMQGGIVYSNFVNTVSPTYAGEAKDRHGAFGLEPVLHRHHVKYGGILNGIDCDVWNPEVDSHLPAPFGVATIERKYDNKRALRHRLLLADNEKPIVGFIGRLDPQKGLDLVRHALFYCVNHGAQFVLLGSGAEPGINEYFLRIKHEINENPDSHIEIGHDEDLAHLIYGGVDLMIVPSRFEPCGLTQLIAMRYGAVPIVRAVGGLADTVFDKDLSDRPLHARNGYVFHHDNEQGIESALSRAIACYYLFPDHFRHLMLNAMRSDYSWNIPGQHYLNVYDYIRSK